jgi:hypothetical protein
MRWAVAGVMVVAAVACAEAPPATCVDEVAAQEGGAPPPAYVGFRWACDHAPPCAVAIRCADPAWRRMAATGLDARTVRASESVSRRAAHGVSAAVIAFSEGDRCN